MSTINVHYVELFYYVARHGGMTPAIAKMPFGIGQSALSSQLLQLEEQVGAKLFERRPFRLTPAGRELFTVAQPFFEELENVAERLRSGGRNLIRVGAPRSVLGIHLPPILKRLRASFPKLRPRLRSGWRIQIDDWFRAGDLDLAVTVLEGKPPPGCQAERFMRVPMCLLVPRSSPIRSAAQLWENGPVAHSLVGPDAEDDVTRTFRSELSRRMIRWPEGMEAETLDLIETYVHSGFGVGLSVFMPGRKFAPGLRVLPLPGFPELNVGLLWRKKPTPIAQALLRDIRAYASELRATADT
jgi:DNA-binding transcriptional LysR family regulator